VAMVASIALTAIMENAVVTTGILVEAIIALGIVTVAVEAAHDAKQFMRSV